MQFWPRKRSKHAVARARFARKKSGVLGFVGYKAGMTRVSYVDNRPKAATKGETIRKAVTVIEIPSIKVIGARAYAKDVYGTYAVGEFYTNKLDKELGRKITLPKKANQEVKKRIEAMLDDLSELRIIIHTQPKLIGLKNKPDLLEIPIGGKVREQWEQVNSVLGKEIDFEDVFKPGELLDAHAVTKGKGFQGVIKRFGVKLMSHKAEKGRRKIATLGNRNPAKTWMVAHPGQMGYHARTEYNKQVLFIGDAKEKNVTPNGGFLKYGEVKGKYALFKGSIPGPKKRAIVFSHAVKVKSKAFLQAPEIRNISERSQQ